MGHTDPRIPDLEHPVSQGDHNAVTHIRVFDRIGEQIVDQPLGRSAGDLHSVRLRIQFHIQPFRLDELFHQLDTLLYDLFQTDQFIRILFPFQSVGQGAVHHAQTLCTGFEPCQFFLLHILKRLYRHKDRRDRRIELMRRIRDETVKRFDLFAYRLQKKPPQKVPYHPHQDKGEYQIGDDPDTEFLQCFVQLILFQYNVAHTEMFTVILYNGIAAAILDKKRVVKLFKVLNLRIDGFPKTVIIPHFKTAQIKLFEILYHIRLIYLFGRSHRFHHDLRREHMPLVHHLELHRADHRGAIIFKKEIPDNRQQSKYRSQI